MYLFLERGEGKQKERERNINVWLSPAHPPLGTWSATQAYALTGNWTSNPLVHRPTLNPLNYASQGYAFIFNFVLLVDYLFIHFFLDKQNQENGKCNSSKDCLRIVCTIIGKDFLLFFLIFIAKWNKLGGEVQIPYDLTFNWKRFS